MRYVSCGGLLFTVFVGSALSASRALAQTTYNWQMPVNGFWSVSTNWTPFGTPWTGDMAVLGGVGMYTVTADATREVAGITLLNPASTLLVPDGVTLTIQTSASGKGKIVLAGSSGISVFRLAESATLDCPLFLVADGHISRAQLGRALNGPGIATIGPNSTITGNGQIIGAFSNDGLIVNGSNGAILEVADSITQSPGGIIRAGAGGTLAFTGFSRTMSGGTIDVEPGALTRTPAAGNGTRFQDLAIQGVFTLPGTQLKLAGTISGSGEILASGATGNGWVSVEENATVGVDVRLAAGVNLAQARLDRIGIGTATIAAGTTVTGNGQIIGAFSWGGTLSPGMVGSAPIGQFSGSAGGTLLASSLVVVDAAGATPTEHDRITGILNLALGGTLTTNLISGYVPAIGHSLTLMQGSGITGQFAQVNLPQPPSGVECTVCYSSTAVRLVFHCPADVTTGAVLGQAGYGCPNGTLNNDDFFYFLAQFAAGNLAVADVTTTAVPGSPGYGVPNGVVNNDDFFYYLSIFAAGC